MPVPVPEPVQGRAPVGQVQVQVQVQVPGQVGRRAPREPVPELELLPELDVPLEARAPPVLEQLQLAEPQEPEPTVRDLPVPEPLVFQRQDR